MCWIGDVPAAAEGPWTLSWIDPDSGSELWASLAELVYLDEARFQLLEDGEESEAHPVCTLSGTSFTCEGDTELAGEFTDVYTGVATAGNPFFGDVEVTLVQGDHRW